MDVKKQIPRNDNGKITNRNSRAVWVYGNLIKGRKDLWGNCNADARRISLQLEIAGKVFREKSVIEDRE